MTLTIEFPPAILEKLQQQARLAGKGVNDFVVEAVAAKVQRSSRTLEEILEPIRKDVESSGISDDELDAMFERELAAVRAESKSRP
jgi:hypothetical protein